MEHNVCKTEVQAPGKLDAL